MKLSLKGFFIHEALGDEGDRSARGMKRPPPESRYKLGATAGSTHSADANKEFQSRDPRYREPMTKREGIDEATDGTHVVAYDETGRGDQYGEAVEVGQFPSYEAAAQWVASKTNGDADPESEKFVIYPIEDWLASASDTSKMGAFQEHQDPTANVDAGSSIWSDPDQPVDVKKFSNKGGNLHIDLCEMFGINEMGGPGSGRGRPKGSKNLTQAERDARDAAKGPPGKRGRPLGYSPKLGGFKPGTVVPGKVPDADFPDEMPDDFDVPAAIDQQADDEHSFASKMPGEEDGKLPTATPEDDADAGDIDWGDRDEESWLDDPSLGAGTELPQQADKPFVKKPRVASAWGGETPVQYSPELQSWIDDNPTQKSEPKDKGQFWKDVNADDLETMEWEELQATEPEIASDIEREYPDLIEPGFFAGDPDLGVPRERALLFAKNKDGDVILYQGGGRGERFKWDKDKKELISMDDGGTPAGEF